MGLGPRELRGMELRRMELRMEFRRRGMVGVEERFMAAHMVMAHDWTVEQVLEVNRCGISVGTLHDVLKAYGMLEGGIDDGLIVTVEGEGDENGRLVEEHGGGRWFMDENGRLVEMEGMILPPSEIKRLGVEDCICEVRSRGSVSIRQNNPECSVHFPKPEEGE